MKITPIDQRHVDGSALELLRRIQPSKTTTQDQDTVPRCHRERPFRSNLALRPIISLSVMFLNSIRRERKPMRYFRSLVSVLLCFPVVCVSADSPAPKAAEG